MPNKIIPYNPIMRRRSRALRKSSTIPERILWNKIKNRTLGVQFHRQVSMSNSCVDFYCHKIGLAIELDGRYHDDQISYDAYRQGAIENHGVRFLRFTNEQIYRMMFWAK